MKSLVIKKRFDALVAQRKTLDDTLQIIERFVVPHRGEFFKPMASEGEVDWRRRDIFDSTAVDANETLASSLQGSLTSPSTKWFALGFRQDALNEEQEALEWLEDCGNIIYQALIDSNFNLESAEFYLDLTSYGTAIIVEEAESETEWKGIDFQAAPIRDCYFEMDHKNQVLRFYRQYQWTPLQIIDKFGDKVPDMIKQRAEAMDSNDNRFSIVFCVYARADKKLNIESTQVLAASERPYGWKWVCHHNGEQLGDEGGYYEMPAFVARWRKTSGSQWGYSPAHICLSDILTLNELTEETLEALGKVVDPSTLVTERNLLSDLDLGRGGMTVVKDLDGIKSYESGARFDVGELKIDRLQKSIQRAFRVDQLEMKDSPAMTATEVNVRYELMQRLLGPTLGRLESDYLDPLINRTFKILSRAGQLPEVPQVVKDIKGELDIEYVGPLPRAQRQEVVQATNAWVGMIASLLEVFPELRDLPDIDRIGRETAKMSGLPAKYLNSDAKVKQIREDRAAQEEQMQQTAMDQAQGEAMEAQGKGAQALTQQGGERVAA
jgi:head-to-tail connecting protein